MESERAAGGHNVNKLAPGTVFLSRAFGDGQQLILEPKPSDDPNDPLNWIKFRKTVNFALVLAASIIVFTALSIQVIFWQLMTIDLNLTYGQLNNGRSTNFVGLAVGCAFFIPFTRKYGRRSTYILSLAVMAATSFWSARMHTLAELYLTNLFQGLAGAINETIVEMTIADLFFVHQRGTANAFYLTAVMSGSFLTPLVAGVQAARQGWRASYYTLGEVNIAIWLLFVFFYEETKYVPMVDGICRVLSGPGLQISENEQSHGDNDQKLNSESAVKSGSRSAEVNDSPQRRINPRIPLLSRTDRLRWSTKTDESLWKLFYLPFVILVSFPHVIFTALQYAAGVVWLTIMSSILSIVFSAPPYNFSTAALGYMGLGPFVGNLIGSIYGGLLGDWVIVFCSRRNKGYFEPEMRLYMMALPALSMAGGLIMFFVTTDKGMHYIYPSIGGALFGFGLGSIGDTSLTMIIDTYTQATGESFVGVAFLRNAVSIGIPFCITPWMAVSSLTNIGLACGFISLAISLLFIPMIIYGKRIRTALGPKYFEFLEKEMSHSR